MKGLLIKSPWIDLILSSDKEEIKIWEIRNSNAHIRGTIGLIKSGTGTIVGTTELVDSFPLTAEELKANFDKHKVPDEILLKFNYDTPHAWVFQNSQKFEKPIPYCHPQGAIRWVNLDENELLKGKIHV